jgi:hypothetical protein
MRLGVTIEDRPAHIQQRLDHCRKDNIRAFDQLAHARFILAAADGSDQQSVGSQRAANVVLDFDQLALQKLAVRQKLTHLLHFDILRIDGAEPAQSHHLCNTTRIVPIGLVAHRRQRHPHVTGL